MFNGKIHNEEIKYIAYSVGFAFVFFVLIVPFLLKSGIGQTSPFIQFAIFNVTIFIFLQIYLKSKVLDTSIKVRKTFEMMLIFMALDTWVPPLMTTLNGTLVTEAVLSASASDYLWGFIAISLGLKGIFVYMFTYLLVPTALLFIASKLNGSFVRSL